MDFCHQTGLGVFFSKPNTDSYLTDERSDELLQLNFFSKDLEHLKTMQYFLGLTKTPNHDMNDYKNSEKLNNEFDSIKNSSIQTWMFSRDKYTNSDGNTILMVVSGSHSITKFGS
jgi:hypothetical protein